MYSLTRIRSADWAALDGVPTKQRWLRLLCPPRHFVAEFAAVF